MVLFAQHAAKVIIRTVITTARPAQLAVHPATASIPATHAKTITIWSQTTFSRILTALAVHPTAINV